MMQYTNKKICYLFALRITVPLILLSFSRLISAGTQFEVKGFDILGEDIAGSKHYKKAIINPYFSYLGTYNLTSYLQLLTEEKYEGILPINYKRDTLSNALTPLSERKVLSSNISGVGLRFTRFDNAEVSIRNILYLDTMSIFPQLSARSFDKPYSDDSLTRDSILYGLLYYDHSQMIRKSRTSVNLYWSHPIGSVELCADVNYFILNYIGILKVTQTAIDSVLSRDKFTDIDQLFNGSIRYSLPHDFKFSIETHLKQNLSGYAFSNLYQFGLFFGGDHSFPSNNQLTWNLGVKSYSRASKSTMPKEYIDMVENYYKIAKGPINRIYLRDIYTLSYGFFLKATIMADLGNQLYKQRYEISVRKATQSGAYVDAGYFTAIGGLFPIQGTYIRTRYCPISSLELSGTTKFLWEQSELYDNKGNIYKFKYKYLKNVTSGELAYKFWNEISLLGGVDYSFFNHNNEMIWDYPGRISGYVGIRGLL